MVDGTISIKPIAGGQNIEFHAFLTDFKDSFTANWNSQELFGKVYPIYLYKNTVRKINFSFDVPSNSAQEAAHNFRLLKLLMSRDYVYPQKDAHPGLGNDAKGASVITHSPLIRITFENLVFFGKNEGLLGWIDGFEMKPNFDNGTFFNVNNTEILPKLYNCSISFNVVHERALGQPVG